MGGKSTSQTTQTAQSTTNPWAPTVQPLQGVIGGVNGLIPNTGVSPTQQGAIQTLTQNAQAGNPYAPQISNTTNTLLSGGGGPNTTGMATDAYNAYKSAVTPWVNNIGDPTQNPALRQALDVIRNDVSNSVNGQFAAAGRDLSGANTQALARGIAQGEAPTILNAQQLGLGTAQDLYNAGGNTAGLLSNLHQTQLGNQITGAQLAPSAIDASNYGANQLLSLGQLPFDIPAQNLSTLAGILGPIAGLGGQTSSTGTAQNTNQMSGAQRFALLGNGFNSFLNPFKG